MSTATESTDRTEPAAEFGGLGQGAPHPLARRVDEDACLLYTSDAADE